MWLFAMLRNVQFWQNIYRKWGQFLEETIFLMNSGEIAFTKSTSLKAKKRNFKYLTLIWRGQDFLWNKRSTVSSFLGTFQTLRQIKMGPALQKRALEGLNDISLRMAEVEKPVEGNPQMDVHRVLSDRKNWLLGVSKYIIGQPCNLGSFYRAGYRAFEQLFRQNVSYVPKANDQMMSAKRNWEV